ncbi:tRNA (guanosine(37)-N1)-methyltransferase TrmD [Candidatus Nitrospira allomarina]|jgi:tRNA (guanine37-N1)-methyltransferase|uniref:tRNA (guanine-N(1)-)-methyltransferase n=1 Tax=Candidatus Nitrospira allomarina TaxID=3020900 RepID=A0AA96JSP4_9BACT|nr:tRNA (guanosine(37)-N1)-methyltransferase TrmD [Candidatus Nitrospira allomarina]WNM58305.1 tRNA (guanosine(37)-N1)-methyltransferase TrmD [Candidatus Nitrospira allomarina]
MRCDILTLFPELIHSVSSQSIMKRAQDKGLLTLNVYNIRDYTHDPHRTADDTPYGGGGGMVMKAEPIFQAIDRITPDLNEIRIIIPSPQGIRFSHGLANDLSQDTRPLLFICGHYEGIDERVRTHLRVEEISLGDYVLTGGELAALVMIDAAMRLIPGVLGDPHSAQRESFVESLLDYPHFTKPVEIRGMSVPDILMSGNHEAIRRWRRKESLRQTLLKRPDLLNNHTWSSEDRELLEEIEHNYTSTSGRTTRP